MAEEQVGTIARAIQLLRAIAEASEPQSVSGLAAKLSLPSSTVHRLLQLLKEDEMVEAESSTRRYRPGRGLYRLAESLTRSRSIVGLARPFLVRIVQQCDETCVLSVPIGIPGVMRFVDQVESSQALRISMPLNEDLPIIWGASGLSLLAGISRDEAASLLRASAASPVSGAAVPDLDEFWQTLELNRARGYAFSVAQKIAGSIGISAPIVDQRGRAVAAITVTVPVSRFEAASEGVISRLVVEAAREVSATY